MGSINKIKDQDYGLSKSRIMGLQELGSWPFEDKGHGLSNTEILSIHRSLEFKDVMESWTKVFCFKLYPTSFYIPEFESR